MHAHTHSRSLTHNLSLSHTHTGGRRVTLRNARTSTSIHTAGNLPQLLDFARTSGAATSRSWPPSPSNLSCTEKSHYPCGISRVLFLCFIFDFRDFFDFCVLFALLGLWAHLFLMTGLMTNLSLQHTATHLSTNLKDPRWGWVFLERTRILESFQFTRHFIECVVVYVLLCKRNDSSVVL